MLVRGNFFGGMMLGEGRIGPRALASAMMIQKRQMQGQREEIREVEREKQRERGREREGGKRRKWPKVQ